MKTFFDTMSTLFSVVHCSRLFVVVTLLALCSVFVMMLLLHSVVPHTVGFHIMQCHLGFSHPLNSDPWD